MFAPAMECMLIRTEATPKLSPRELIHSLMLHELPFGLGDVTAGSEDELQAVVTGKSQFCDLPVTLRESKFYRNLAKHISSGEAPRRTYLEIEEFLNDSAEVWENSWIRFPERRLSAHALDTFRSDLGLDPRATSKPIRTDRLRYTFEHQGGPWIRVPISYSLKLALADLTGTQPHMPQRMRIEAERLLGHFSNDNTSPETTSFHVVEAAPQRSLGEQLARESARCFLFTTLLMSWANRRFGLAENGQRGMVYHGPHPPVRQTEISSCISDAFYRELFISPCLSGWDDGEAKAEYMHLCHQVLTRSQLNSVAKLREAGIIANNLIVLPSPSNVSLANNGIHVSMGSRSLCKALQNQEPSVASREEKRLGDLAIKIFEHFLPLFVGTYSAAPYRIDFAQFHPESLLAFLPHELDFTHLRLMWREWKEKANLKVLGHPATPYGPVWLDRAISGIFRLRGDLVPDYRLLNYPVAWLSTEHASALDGEPGNIARLAAELDQLGIVDRRMSFYMPLRLRQFQKSGYSGFEARYYSLFPSYDRDMAPATDLQQLLLAATYQMALQGTVLHEQIPDDPTAESERRQPFFFSAAGLPAFYVHKRTRNEFLGRILRHCRNTRSSWRHPDYLRVSISDYRHALLAFLAEEAAGTVEDFQAMVLLGDLRWRLADKSQRASERLTADILNTNGERNAMRTNAAEFNRATEKYYREQVRQSQLSEALRHLREDIRNTPAHVDGEFRAMMRCGVRVQDPMRLLDSVSERLLQDELTAAELEALLNLLLVFSATQGDHARTATRNESAMHKV
jgi:hypothetical protein